MKRLDSMILKLQICTRGTRFFTTTALKQPSTKPKDPKFGSGPCRKRPGYSLPTLINSQNDVLGRSHRSKLGKARLRLAIDLTRDILNIPKDYLVGIVPGSDTGAFEMAMWNLLPPNGPVDVFYWDSFGKGWQRDIVSELAIKDVKVGKAEYGEIVDLKTARDEADLVFTFNGTTSGVRVPDGFQWKERKGLTLCDATSAAFAMDLPWQYLDATTFSWQKVLGGEGAHGVLVLSPKAVSRLEGEKNWERGLPKVFRMVNKGKVDRTIFEGSTINTPSMLCVEDYIDALNWAKSIGGLPQLLKRSRENLRSLEEFVDANSDWISFLPKKKEIRSSTSICLTLKGLDDQQLKKMVKVLEDEKVAVDIASYRDAPAGIRIWGGATVDNDDIKALLPWIKYAYQSVTK